MGGAGELPLDGRGRLLWKSFGITVGYAGLFVPLAFFAGLGLALLVSEHFPGVAVVRAALFLPNAVSLVVIGLLWQFLLTDKTGAVAKLTGLHEVSWLGDPTLALLTLVLISVWFLMGYQMLIFLGGLQDIPREYYDAATVDGGGPWQRFRHVTWPMLRPTSFFVLVTSLINAVTGLQVFDLVYVLTSGGPANSTTTTTTVVYYAYQQAFLFGRFGYASAICALLVVALGAITGVLFALTRGGRFDAYVIAFGAVAPLLWFLLSAFRPESELYSLGWPNELTLALAYVLTEVPFLRYLANSAFVAVSVTVIALFLHSMAAYALARLSFRGRGFAFASVVATLLISLPVILVPLFMVVRALGLVDTYAGLIVPGLFNAFGSSSPSRPPDCADVVGGRS